jgi:hypothetical protein
MIDSNTYPLELTAIELQSWLPHIVEGFEARIQQQQQILELRVSPDLPSLVSDLTSLTEIISELLNNACKYTPANEQIQITAQFVNITESVVNEDAKSDVSNNLEIPYFEIIISNSGVEIPINEQSRIFDPFYRIVQNQTQEQSQIFDRVYQIVQSDRRYYGNTGLGLSLVKKLVEYLQGTIEVNSSQGWTNFILKLSVRILEE